VGFVFINYHDISNQELIGVIMVLLYLTGPIAILLAFAPQLAISKVSLNKVNRLFELLPEEQSGAAEGSTYCHGRRANS
jgi:putative ATP-binding cassette transporter